MQPRFAVQVLALEAQVLLFDEEAFLRFGQGVAPDLVARLPDAAAVVFGELLRQAVGIGVVIAQARVFALAIDTRQRVVAAFVVEVEAVPAVAGFAEQAQAVPYYPLLPFQALKKASFSL